MISVQRRVVWMRNWLELKNEGDEADDFVERFKDEYPKQVIENAKKLAD